MSAPIDPARAEAHARHNVAEQGTVIATSVVAALLDLLDAERDDHARARVRAHEAETERDSARRDVGALRVELQTLVSGPVR